jgi:hypothetical protein
VFSSPKIPRKKLSLGIDWNLSLVDDYLTPKLQEKEKGCVTVLVEHALATAAITTLNAPLLEYLFSLPLESGSRLPSVSFRESTFWLGF